MMESLKFGIHGKRHDKAAWRGVQKDLSKTQGMMAGLSDKSRRFGRGMRNVGLGMTAAVSAPLGLLAKQFIELQNVQEAAEASTRQAVISTNGAAGFGADQLFRMASGLQELTAVGDESILRDVTTPLLTFTKITGKQFPRAQTAVLDMARTLQMDLKSASIQVGKALNDPIKGVTALGRAGVMFTDDQKDVIGALVRTGKVAEAQGIILKELETQFGGQAAAYAKTTSGMMESLSDSIGDLKEQLGAEMVPFLLPLIDHAKRAATWFGNLSPEVKKNIVVFGGLAAAAGPAMAILGLGIMAASPLIGVLAALVSPIGAVAGAVAVLGVATYRNWDLIQEKYPAIAGVIETSGAVIEQKSSKVWDALKIQSDGFLKSLDLTATGIDALISGDIGGAWDAVEGLWAVSFKTAKSTLAVFFGDVAARITLESIDLFGPMIDSAKTGMADFKTTLNAKWLEVKTQISQWADPFKNIGRDMIDGLKSGVAEKWAGFKTYLSGLMPQVPAIFRKGWKIQSPSRVFMEIGGHAMSGLTAGFQRGEGALKGVLSAISGRTLSGASDLFSSSSNIAQGPDAAAKIVSIVDAAKNAETQLNQSASAAANFFTGVIQQGKSAEQVIADLGGMIVEKLLNNTLMNIFSGLGGGFLDFLFNANGNAFSGGGVTAFARGGVVNSPTMFPMNGGRAGLMGEAGPEAIMPLTRIGGRLGVMADVQAGQGPSPANVGPIKIEVNVQTQSDQPGEVGRETAAALQGLISNIVDERMAQGQRGQFQRSRRA